MRAEAIESMAPHYPTVREIVHACAKYFRIEMVDLLSRRRTKDVVHCRQMAMYLARTMTLRSMPEIGRILNRMDHTTILWAYRKIKSLIETDREIAAQILELRFIINNHEEWKPHPIFQRYLISSIGRVKFYKSENVRKPHHPTNGYPCVSMIHDGQYINPMVHSLVAETFIGPRPPGMEVRHLDGDRANAKRSNLAYGTKIENAEDRDRHGNTARGERNGNVVVSDERVRIIRVQYAAGRYSQYELAARYGISQAQVNNIVLNKQRVQSHAKTG